MAGPDESRLLPEGVSDAESARATDAFAALGNETRLAVLLVLWDDYEPFGGDNSVTFSTLQERVGVDDSGQFSYHLNQLLDDFVEATDDGYKLRKAGHKIVRTVVAGVGLEEPALDTTDTDLPCAHCDAPTVISYEDRTLSVACPNCGDAGETDDDGVPFTLMEVDFNPAGIAGRTADEVLRANSFRVNRQNAMRLFGICPECSGVVESWFDICESHDTAGTQPCSDCQYHEQFRVRFVCTACKDSMEAPTPMVAAVHPTVQSFHIRHGYPTGFAAETVSFFDQFSEYEEALTHEHEVVSEDPLRVSAAVTHDDGSHIRVVFDENVDVVDIEESE
ncbi:ArsR/SmtB family transcription factor [Haloarchaeobius sp. DFWS5]|uniref:ArsR/SmtB family transcription factor n=1 Tax=Haloarchaeobius sp. DFWS5 TaxID=3446114 RepID=UPI003EBD9748